MNNMNDVLTYMCRDLQTLTNKMQQALELIATGDVQNPKEFADSVLVELGIWEQENN